VLRDFEVGTVRLLRRVDRQSRMGLIFITSFVDDTWCIFQKFSVVEMTIKGLSRPSEMSQFDRSSTV